MANLDLDIRGMTTLLLRVSAVLLGITLLHAAQVDRGLKILEEYKEHNWAPYMALTL